MMKINCYGERCEGAPCDKMLRRRPLETKCAGGVTYARFGEGGLVPVHRLGVGPDGRVAETWAYGRWEDAETLDYSPLDETKEVNG